VPLLRTRSAASLPPSLDSRGVQDPTVSRAAKKDVRAPARPRPAASRLTLLSQVLSSALKSVTVNPITKNFLLLLAENGRINILEKIQSAYTTIMQAHRNEVPSPPAPSPLQSPLTSAARSLPW
jgi:hypothetical protein